MKKTENQFRERLVRDLEKRGVKVFSLGQGTMDLWFDDSGLFGEVKRVGWGVFRARGFEDWFCISRLNKLQTRMIRETGKVLVIGFDKNGDRYWLWTPRGLARLNQSRTRFPTLVWCRGVDHRPPFDHPLSYRKLLEKLTSLTSPRDRGKTRKRRRQVQSVGSKKAS